MKVLRAYWLLVEEPEPGREKGYVPALYAGIKRCLPDKHIHLPASTDYITALVARVHPDIIGRFVPIFMYFVMNIYLECYPIYMKV